MVTPFPLILLDTSYSSASFLLQAVQMSVLNQPWTCILFNLSFIVKRKYLLPKEGVVLYRLGRAVATGMMVGGEEVKDEHCWCGPCVGD